MLQGEDPGICRVTKLVEIRRDLQSGLFEPRLVVVDAHVAEIDRCHHLALGVEAGNDVAEQLTRMFDEDPLFEGAGEKCVVHTEEHVGERVVFGQGSLIHHRAGVTGRDDLHVDPGLSGECSESLLVHGPDE